MHILLIAATRLEINPVADWLSTAPALPDQQTVEVLITGVGGLNTAALVSEAVFTRQPGFLLQAGIAGSFDPSCPPGQLVLIGSETTGDLGVEENNIFKDLADMRLQEPDAFPYTQNKLVNPGIGYWQHLSLPVVNSISINEITTRAERISQLQQKYQPVVESMEGAAFHLVSLRQRIPFLQLRAISNFVGERNKEHWKMKEAITALNEKLKEILSSPFPLTGNDR